MEVCIIPYQYPFIQKVVIFLEDTDRTQFVSLILKLCPLWRVGGNILGSEDYTSE